MTQQDRGSEAIHQTYLLRDSVNDFKKGLIGPYEIAIAVSNYISFMWPEYSEQKQNDIFQALIEKFGIVFE